MKTMLKIAALFTLAMTLVGCSSGPSDSEIREAITASEGKDIMEITEIERINGYEDGDRYIVDLKYTATFTVGYREAISQANAMDQMAIQMLTLMLGKWDKGDTIQDQSEFVFVESENGWIIIE